MRLQRLRCRRRRLLTVAVLLTIWTAPRPSAVAAPSGIVQRVLDDVQNARREAGIAALRYRDDLERVARERAELLAALPHARRLAERVDGRLDEAGIKLYRRSTVHVDLNRGYHDPAEAFIRSWRGYRQSWDNAVSPVFTAIGMATEKASDGWVVLVAILIEETELPDTRDLRAMEQATVEAINRTRADRGVPPLATSSALTSIARAHSEDMARQRYFGHNSPDGSGPRERVLRQGLGFRRVGENIHSNGGVDDPVAFAIRSWLESKGHRGILLDERFVETGVGIAVTTDGTYYFTQLFLLPAAEKGD